MATLGRFYSGCSAFCRPEWRRSRRITPGDHLGNVDDPDVESGEPSRPIPRRDQFRILGFYFSRSTSFSSSLAVCFCVVSVVLFLDRTVDMEIREQEHVGWSSGSAKLKYDHAQRSAPPRLRSTASNSKSHSGVVHKRRLSLGEGATSSNSNSHSQSKDRNSTSSSSDSDPEVNVEGWEASKRLLKAKGALRGLGTILRRGSRAMSELVVAHLDEQTTPTDLKLFLRTLHRSGVTARADVVILFPRGIGEEFIRALHDEEKSFWRLMVQQQSVAPIHVENQQKSSKTSRARDSASDTVDVSTTSHANLSHFTSSRPLSRVTNGGFLGPRTVIKQTGQMSLQEKLIGELKNSALHGPPAGSLYHGDGLFTRSFGPSPLVSAAALVRNTLKSVNSTFINYFNVNAFWQSREEGIERKGKGRRRDGEIPWESPASKLREEADQKRAAAVTWGDWGSVVVFDMRDLGSEEIMSGFIKNPPASLQRWMCYELLLGVVRKQYATVLLTEITGVVLLGDLMSVVRNTHVASAGGAYLFSEDRTWGQAHHEEMGISVLDGDLERKAHKLDNRTSPQIRNDSDHGVDSTERSKKSFIRSVYGAKRWQTLEEHDFQKSVLVSGILLGGLKTVQSLSRAMTSEIVRVAAILRNSTEPFADQPVLNYLVLKGTIVGRKLRRKLTFVPCGSLKVHIVAKTNQKSSFLQEASLQMFHAVHGFKDGVVSKATGELITQSIHAHICSSAGASYVYNDCQVLPVP